MDAARGGYCGAFTGQVDPGLSAREACAVSDPGRSPHLRTLPVHLRAQWAGFLALFLVLAGGTAYAADTDFSTDIVDGEVKHSDLAGNAVTSTNMYNGSVLSPAIATDAVDSSTARTGRMTAADLATARSARPRSPPGVDPGGHPDLRSARARRRPRDDVRLQLSGTTQAAITNLPIRTVTYG